jgi:limonene-1,2-epoxide hydrolase
MIELELAILIRGVRQHLLANDSFPLESGAVQETVDLFVDAKCIEAESETDAGGHTVFTSVTALRNKGLSALTGLLRETRSVVGLRAHTRRVEFAILLEAAEKTFLNHEAMGAAREVDSDVDRSLVREFIESGYVLANGSPAESSFEAVCGVTQEGLDRLAFLLTQRKKV